MASNVLIYTGTVKSFKASGGDVAWTLTSLGNGAGRISAILDLGAAPRAFEYEWRLLTKFASTPAVGSPVRLYVVTSADASGVYQDGGGTLGVADAAVASNENLLIYGGKQQGPTVVQHTSAANLWSGRFICTARYLSFALWNASGQALTGTAGDHELTLTPYFRQSQ